MKDRLSQVFAQYNIILNEKQCEQFQKYYQFLIEENQKYNLTAITEEDEVITKHFLDSVLPEKEILTGASVVDVGSGAGFPGIPLKILRPDLKIILVDSLQKRVNFLNQVINLLNLQEITAVHARAEDYALKNREKFDYAVSRAVAQSNTLVEYLLPLVKIGGYALLYKSQKVEEEIGVAEKAITVLGGKVEQTLSFEIADMKRTIIVLKKVTNCPRQYPRGKNLPKTKPII